jgi:hypothetical protein
MTSASNESPMTSVETGPTDFVYLALLHNSSSFSLVMPCPFTVMNSLDTRTDD